MKSEQIRPFIIMGVVVVILVGVYYVYSVIMRWIRAIE